jgi:hypothetical protein
MIKRLFILTLFSAGLTHAASINVTNSDFEDPDLSAGATWTNTFSGWTGNGGGGAGGGASFVERIGPAFFSDGAQHVGMNDGYFLWQDTGVAWAANTQYSLTVAVGNRNDGFTVPGNSSTYSLYNFSPTGESSTAAGALASMGYDAEANAADGFFVDAPTLTHETGGTAPGGNIWIMISGNGGGRSHFDNIRLDGTVIPEPTVGLLAGLAGLAGLLLLRRRR